MTIERLMDSDGGLVPVFQLRQMIPGVWAENQWTGDTFTSAVEAMVPDNAAGRSARGQVAAVRQFLHETAVRHADLAHYIPSGKVEDEIERRKNGNKIDSLVAVTWARAFPVLKKVFVTNHHTWIQCGEEAQRGGDGARTGQHDLHDVRADKEPMLEACPFHGCPGRQPGRR